MNSDQAPPVRNRCVVRLRTTVWNDKHGLHMRKSLTFLRRQSSGFNLLEEDAGGIGVESVLQRIVNLKDCDDGIYAVVTCNESRDWESGRIDDYDYRLVSYSISQKGTEEDLSVISLPALDQEENSNEQHLGLHRSRC